MLPVFAARATAVLMVGIAAFQVALVFGAPWGAYTQGGETEGALGPSGRVFAAVSCVILLVMAAAILARVREGPLKNAPGRLVTALAWFTTVYSALAVVLNLTTQSSSERAVFAPTAILLLVLVLTAMVGSRHAR
jgi:carbon starvation protein CstA